MAATGPYAAIRYPQYVAFVLILFGCLIQWPTLPTMVMFPILVWVYVRLAIREEKEALKSLGEVYACYAGKTPRFIPMFYGLSRPPKNDLVNKPILVYKSFHNSLSIN